MTRAEKLWDLYTRCVRANQGTLFHDHGRVLKRVIREPGRVQGIARPTKLTLADVLLTWDWVNQKVAPEYDADSIEVIREIRRRIVELWDQGANDLALQSDACIDKLAEILLVEIPKSRRKI